MATATASANKPLTFEQLNPKQQAFAARVKNGENAMVTGPAGTGKSALLQYLCSQYPDLHVTASTGIAALNVGGCTLHSWASLGIGEEPAQKIAHRIIEAKKTPFYMMKTASRLAIDEISMIDADLFQKASDVLKIVRKSSAPFGGLQLILFGDLLQLPPVARDGRAVRFAFESKAWQEARIHVFVLDQVMRQKDEEFAGVLSRVRVGDTSDEVRSKLRPRINAPDPNPEVVPVNLRTHNADADRINFEKLAELPGEESTWEASDTGSEYAQRTLDQNCIAPKTLRLKVGARVMLLWNIEVEAGLANGTLGEVVEIKKSIWGTVPVVKFSNGTVMDMEKQSLEMKKNGEVIASRMQYPLRLSWAISIHKSQGLTLEKIRVSLKRTFADGQAYVALSRAKTLEGLFIADISGNSIRANAVALEFYRRFAS
jgi:ATP-dependent DNA helicase PIF1